MPYPIKPYPCFECTCWQFLYNDGTMLTVYEDVNSLRILHVTACGLPENILTHWREGYMEDIGAFYGELDCKQCLHLPNCMLSGSKPYRVAYWFDRMGNNVAVKILSPGAVQVLSV